MIKEAESIPVAVKYIVFDGHNYDEIVSLIGSQHVSISDSGLQVNLHGGRWEDVFLTWAVLIYKKDNKVGILSSEALLRYFPGAI